MKVVLNAEKIDVYLAVNNYSDEEFAKVVQITKPHFSRLKNFEKYGISASPKLRKRMLETLDCKFGDIFFTSNGN